MNRTAETRCTKIEDWPATDRELWTNATRKSDPFSNVEAPRSTQRNITNKGIERSYGRFLTFLTRRNLLAIEDLPASRITPDNIRLFIEDMRSFGNGPGTLHVRLQHLREIGKVFDPQADWSFIADAMARIYPLTRSRDPFAKDYFVSSDDLFDVGMRLMTDASPRQSHDQLLSFRDGLMIAFLALVPIRLRNLSALEIGATLIETGSVWMIRLPAHATKTGRPLEYEWPSPITDHLHRYLVTVRPALAARKGRWHQEVGNRLWVSEDGSPMSGMSVSDRLAVRTNRAFGFPLRAHAFRHAAATTIAIYDPSRARMAAPLLGHSSFQTTERTYVVARALEAHRRYTDSLTANDHLP